MQTQFTKKQIIFLVVAGVVATIIVLVMVGIIPGRRIKPVEIASLTVWGIDDPNVWGNTIGNFSAAFPGIKVFYQQLEERSYKDDLINALAEGVGPDIFMFDNNWLLEHKNKIIPAPAEKISLPALKTLFPRTVEQDFVYEGNVYALPLYIDTLALVYNRDHFDRAGIASPPTSWAEVDSYIPTLRHAKENNQFIIAPFALGGSSKNIRNAPDLLDLFFLQMGSSVSDINLNQIPVYGSHGMDAFTKYLAYSNPSSSLYSWNLEGSDDLEVFARGGASAIFAYAKQLEEIRGKNALLDLEVGTMPQADRLNTIDYPDYYGLVVSNKTLDSGTAWDFVVFATTDEAGAGYYSEAHGLAPALRSLIDADKNSPGASGVYARQALTARSWPISDVNLLDDFLDAAITDTQSGLLTPQEALERLDAQMVSMSEST